MRCLLLSAGRLITSILTLGLVECVIRWKFMAADRTIVMQFEPGHNALDVVDVIARELFDRLAHRKGVLTNSTIREVILS